MTIARLSQKLLAHPRRLAWVMGGVFFGYFFHVGIFTPYWPLWLSAQGASAPMIGTIIALTMIARTLGQPIFSYLADARGGRAVLLGASIAGTLLLLLMPFMPSLTAIAIVAVLATFCLSPLVPVSDAIAVSDPRIRYGHVRLWGSVGFICANVVMGLAIARWGTGLIVPLGGLSLLLVVAFALALPRQPRTAKPVVAQEESAARRAVLGRALRQPALWWLMGAVALINGSHGYYYAFITKYWGEVMGLEVGWFGPLWATGVVAEIAVLAWLGGRTSHRAGFVLLLLASLGGMVRWYLMAQHPPLAMSFILQGFHALSFGAWQLGSVQLMRRIAPPSVITTLMGVQSALSGGVVMAGAIWLGGRLYAVSPEAGFILSAGMSGVGGLLLLGFAKTWRAAASQAIEPHERLSGDHR